MADDMQNWHGVVTDAITSEVIAMITRAVQSPFNNRSKKQPEER